MLFTDVVASTQHAAARGDERWRAVLHRFGPICAGQRLGFTDEQLRSAHAKIGRGETVVLETRDFVTGVPELPPQLFPVPTFPRHEARLLDRLPGYALEAPSMEYVQVNSVSGAAAIVGEGQLKPELDMPATKLIITALKLACHVGRRAPVERVVRRREARGAAARHGQPARPAPRP